MNRRRDPRGATGDPRVLGAAVVAAVLLGSGSPRVARADGMYWPERAVEATPRMPTQRGLVSYRDGVQTLVIEAPVESASRSLGWVVPIPAEPESLEPIRPGLFESLRSCFGPVVVHDRSVEVRRWLLAFGLAALFVALAAGSGRIARAVVGVALVLVLLMVLSLVLVTASLGTTPSVAEVSVVRSQRVGSYEIQVLRAPSARALDDWLSTSGFASLTAGETAIVDDYIHASWVFLASRIVQPGEGTATPHPISVRFPVSSAVYPVRLTALAGGTDFDLWVVAEREASSPLLSTGFVDDFPREKKAILPGIDGASWGARHFDVGIGHPDLQGVLWDACVITRLRGYLTAEDMREDLTFGWKPPRPYRERVYSLSGALSTSAAVFLGVGAVGLSVLPVLRRRDFRRRAHGMIARWVGGALGVGLVAALVVLSTLRIREVAVTGSFPASTMSYVEGKYLGRLLEDGLEAGPEEGADAIRRRIADLVADGLGRLQPDAPRELAAPGGYQVREENGSVFVEYYDSWARPIRVWPLEESSVDG